MTAQTIVRMAQEAMMGREALIRQKLLETAKAEQPGIDLLFALARKAIARNREVRA